MRAGSCIVALAPLALTACVLGGSPSPPALSYSLPEPPTATYVRGDTVTWEIDAGGQTFEMDADAGGTFGVAFTRAGDGVQVDMSVKKFTGNLSQPMQGPMKVDETSITGPLVFTLDRRGNATLVKSPKVSAPADRLFDALSYAHSFFPHLSGAPATPGASWTDTIHFEGPGGGGSIKSTSVITYSITGDTVVGGKSLVHIALQGTAEQTSRGKVAGMDADFSNRVKGNVQGWVLWDAARRLMVESYEQGDAQGTMSVSMAPGPMDVHIRRVSRVKLDQGM